MRLKGSGGPSSKNRNDSKLNGTDQNGKWCKLTGIGGVFDNKII